MCPVCAGKIQEGRKNELTGVLSRLHGDAGCQILMISLTVQHLRFNTCRQLKDWVSGAWRRLWQDKGWRMFLMRRRYVGFVRSMEVTHGDNGWHPHIHALMIFNEIDETIIREIRDELTDRWIRAVEKMGGSWSSQAAAEAHAVDLQLAEPEAAGEYVGKWACADEITKSITKRGRGGRNPWQILADIERGDSASVMLFREYARAFKGTRHLTWSRGLKATWLEHEEPSDLELACQNVPNNGDMEIYVLPRMIWSRVIHRGLVTALLEVAEAGDDVAVDAFLREHGIIVSWTGPPDNDEEPAPYRRSADAGI